MSNKFYTINVETGSTWFGSEGTKNDVQIKLYGSDGTTEYIPLTQLNDTGMEKGANQVFYLGQLDIGDLESVEFQKNKKGWLEDDWGLKSLTLFDGEKYYKSSEDKVVWLKKDEEKKFNVTETNVSQEMSNKLSISGGLNGGNDVINATWFHVIDENGNRDTSGNIEEEHNTYFVTHGFQDGTGNKWINNQFSEWQTDLGRAINEFDPNANVVVVDWHERNYTLAATRPLAYNSATKSVPKISQDIADYIEKNELTPKKVNLIGHSLGAHVSGIAGQEVEGIEQIIGMDPAGPDYQDIETNGRLSPDDAENVYAIHTSGTLGTDGALGDFDLYLNAEYKKSFFGGPAQYNHPNIDNTIVDFGTKYHAYAFEFTTGLFDDLVFQGESRGNAPKVKDLDINKFLDPNSYPEEGQSVSADLNKKYPKARALFFNEANYQELSDEEIIQRQTAAIQLDREVTTGTALAGPLDDAYIFFDTNRNLTWDEGELFTQTDEFGNYLIDITEQNNYTDTTKGVWNGEEFVPGQEQIVDFRDGLIVAVASTDGSQSEIKDIITGEDYGVPFFTIPSEDGKNSNPSIITTFKYAPV
ncbi:MAG: PLAT/LH2 domain-containing protein, partial [Microcoleaceae cyanobacterium]